MVQYTRKSDGHKVTAETVWIEGEPFIKLCAPDDGGGKWTPEVFLEEHEAVAHAMTAEAFALGKHYLPDETFAVSVVRLRDSLAEREAQICDLVDQLGEVADGVRKPQFQYWFDTKGKALGSDVFKATFMGQPLGGLEKEHLLAIVGLFTHHPEVFTALSKYPE